MGSGGKPWDDTETGPACPFFDGVYSILKQGRVAAELVYQKARNHGGIARVQNRLRADQTCDHAALVDVSDQADRDAGASGKPHICNVSGTQVDLRRAAGALHDDKVMGRRQPVEAFHDPVQQLPAMGHVMGRIHGADGLSMHDQLRAPVGFRLQEDGVEISVRFQPAGHGLKRLRAANFSARGTGGRVI